MICFWADNWVQLGACCCGSIVIGLFNWLRCWVCILVGVLHRDRWVFGCCFLFDIVLLWCFAIICLVSFVWLLQVFGFLAGVMWCGLLFGCVVVFGLLFVVLLLFVGFTDVGAVGICVFGLRWFGCRCCWCELSV